MDAPVMPARGRSACTGDPQSMSTRSSTRYAALQPQPLNASPLPTTVSRVLSTAPLSAMRGRFRRRGRGWGRTRQRGRQALLHEPPVEQAARLAVTVWGVEKDGDEPVAVAHSHAHLAVPRASGPPRVDAHGP